MEPPAQCNRHFERACICGGDRQLGSVDGGPISALAGGAAGGLIGLMTTRGVERELANYYQQAVLEGDILVAVDQQDAGESRLEQAAEILSASGARPLSLPEG